MLFDGHFHISMYTYYKLSRRGVFKKYLTDFEWILNKASLLMACTASKWNKIKQIHENASSSK